MKVIYDDERGERTYRDEREMFYECLVNGKVDFSVLASIYVKYLKDLKYLHTKQLSEIDMPLMNVIKPMQHLKGKPTIDAIYRYLVKYERFKGAPVWSELVEYVKENNINIEGSYFVDLYSEVEDDSERNV